MPQVSKRERAAKRSRETLLEGRVDALEAEVRLLRELVWRLDLAEINREMDAAAPTDYEN